MNLAFFIAFFLANSSSVFSNDIENITAAEKLILELKLNYKAMVFEGNPEPKDLPDINSNRMSLIGIDSDNDQIRDDLEIFINRKFTNDFDREIHREYLRRLNSLLKKYKKMTDIETRNAVDHTESVKHCYRYLLDSRNVEKNTWKLASEKLISSQYFNSQLRRDALEEILRKSKGTGTNFSTKEEFFKLCPKSVQLKFPLNK